MIENKLLLFIIYTIKLNRHINIGLWLNFWGEHVWLFHHHWLSNEMFRELFMATASDSFHLLPSHLFYLLCPLSSKEVDYFPSKIFNCTYTTASPWPSRYVTLARLRLHPPMYSYNPSVNISCFLTGWMVETIVPTFSHWCFTGSMLEISPVSK